MASGKIYGSEEDSRSCESGWTMYLASHSHDPDDDCYFDDGDDEDSDGGDSMDSDASSGPMESALNLKLPQEVHEEQNSIQKKKKSNEEMVSVETRVHSKNYDDDDDENDDYYDHDDGNDSYSAVHSYVGAVRQGFV